MKLPRLSPSDSSRRVTFFVVFVLLLVGGFGCSDKPIVDPTLITKIPQLTTGPYVIGSEGREAIVYFETDIPVIPGIRRAGQTYKVQRLGKKDTFHRLSVPGLEREETALYQILLNDRVGPTIRIPGVPPGGKVTLLFAGGWEEDASRLRQSAEAAAKFLPHVTIFTGGLSPATPDPGVWRSHFFDPLSPLLRTAPVVFSCDTFSRIPSSFFPDFPKQGPGWKRTYGCVYLLGVDSEHLLALNRRAEVLDWLRQALTERPPEVKWTILVLSRPPFSAKKVDTGLLDAFGSLLESMGVDLVISGGEAGYHRSFPIETEGFSPIRYLVTAGMGSAGDLGAGREYTAAMANDSHICLLDADSQRLVWRVMAIEGRHRILDTFALSSDKQPEIGEPVLAKRDILSDALATLALKREVLTIARQACRAVESPEGAVELAFLLRNTSSRQMEGQLFWTQPPSPSRIIRPLGMKFSLRAGYEGILRFQVLPGVGGGEVPILTVNMKGIGSSRQPLLLVPLRRLTLFPTQGEGKIDGYLNEPFWNQAARFEDFRETYTGKTPSRRIEARAAYTPTDLLIGFRCEGKIPADPAVFATNHDDPVYRDESVEVFLDPSGNGRDYFQFSVNIANVALDRSSRMGLAWNPSWEHMVQAQREEYVVEMRIPFSALGIQESPSPGSRWRINLTRNDYGKDQERASTPRGYLPEAPPPSSEEKAEVPSPEKVEECEVYQWARTFGSNGRSGLYGEVLFDVPQAKEGARPASP